jgi:hypothetical protein
MTSRALLPFALLLLAGAAPTPVAEKLAGQYALSGVREAAGGLELGADGRFRYGLSYGALDEQAEGRWRQEGNRVLLTTDPTPRAPEWSLVLAEAGEPKLFALILEGPEGRPIPNIEVEVRMKDGSVEQGQTRSEWMEAELDGRVPVAVTFRIPVFDVGSPSFAIDVAKARKYRFRLNPRDLGVRDFRDWPLEIRGDLLAPPDAPEGQGFRRMEVRD